MNQNAPDFENTPASPRRPSYRYALADPRVDSQITIVTPFFNEGLAFHDAAASVFRQSFQQWEWIVVNDGSNDPESLKVLDRYRQSDGRIRIVDLPVNRGPSAARNVGCEVARAPYIAHLDSDNLIEPTALEKWFWYLESHPGCSFVRAWTVGFGADSYLSSDGFHQGRAFLDSNRAHTTTGMIRREVHRAVGGFDESIREGLEDWEFWLRCANAGFWGATLPEYLDWFRRRHSHHDRWKNWDEGTSQRAFRSELQQRYPRLWRNEFPHVRPAGHEPFAVLNDTLPADNVLADRPRRLLMVLPWLAMGGADKFALDLVRELSGREWEITVATTLESTDVWQSEFERYTPDVFPMHRFLRLPDFPRFLRYLARSRRVDTVLVSQSELGYQLLPYLRAHLPEASFIDFCHVEEDWKNGGYPRFAVDFQELLDSNVVASNHLKQWMVGRGADEDRIQVCHLGVDVDEWSPDPDVRRRIRDELDVSSTEALILYAARICDQKQPQVFAKTMLRLARQGVSCVALVAGDGPDFDRLRRFVRRHRLGGQVRLLGAVPVQRINQLMKAVDVFFLPSAWEGIALSIYEAMASGLPVVGADVGGQRELVVANCGVLIQRSTEEAEAAEYAKVLSELIRDPVRRKDMGAAGRDRVKTHFTLNKMIECMVELFDGAHSLRTKNPRPAPGVGLGRASAAQLIELSRRCRETEPQWHDRRQDGVPTVALESQHPNWRTRVYEVLRVLYQPLYQRGLRHGGAWYFPMADRVKKALLRHQR